MTWGEKNLSVHGSSDAIRQMGGVKESSRFRRNGKMNSCCFGAIFRMHKSFGLPVTQGSKKGILNIDCFKYCNLRVRISRKHIAGRKSTNFNVPLLNSKCTVLVGQWLWCMTSTSSNLTYHKSHLEACIGCTLPHFSQSFSTHFVHQHSNMINICGTKRTNQKSLRNENSSECLVPNFWKHGGPCYLLQ